MKKISSWKDHRAANSLANVTTLELALHPSEPTESTLVLQGVLEELPQFFPNVTHLTLDGVNFAEVHALSSVCANLHSLTRVSLKGGHFPIFGAYYGHLRELTLDKCQLLFIIYPNNTALDALRYLLDCRSLERLSMKGTTWGISMGEAQGPVPQDMIMRMARQLPTLHWLRSNLTEQNVAILQEERPEITFVSE